MRFNSFDIIYTSLFIFTFVYNCLLVFLNYEWNAVADLSHFLRERVLLKRAAIPVTRLLRGLHNQLFPFTKVFTLKFGLIITEDNFIVIKRKIDLWEQTRTVRAILP